MAFIDTYNSFKNGTALKNPITDLVSQATSLLESITLISLQPTITNTVSFLNNSKNNIDAMIGGIRTQLPIMTAADSIEKDLGIAQVGSNGAGKNFNDAYAPFTVAEQQINTLILLLSNTFIIDVNNNNSSARTLLQQAIDTMTNEITSSFDASNAARAGALGVIQAHSFAKYATSTENPLHVTAVLSKISNWPT